MKNVFALLTFFTIQFLCSQQNDFVEININAQVLDYETQTGIQFSEVKFLNKNIGALTDDEGNFSLNYLQRSIKNNDILDFLSKNSIVQSKSEARRIIEGKGLKINDILVEDSKKIIKLIDFKDRILKISHGKKKHYIVKIN